MANRRLRAFEEAALVHFDEIFRVARRFIGDAAEAEDLVQETYLRGWKAFDRFEPGTNARAWLYRIFFRTLWARRGWSGKSRRRRWRRPGRDRRRAGEAYNSSNT